MQTSGANRTDTLCAPLLRPDGRRLHTVDLRTPPSLSPKSVRTIFRIFRILQEGANARLP